MPPKCAEINVSTSIIDIIFTCEDSVRWNISFNKNAIKQSTIDEICDYALNIAQKLGFPKCYEENLLTTQIIKSTRTNMHTVQLNFNY